MCLVGNKSDLEESRQVNVKEAQEYADSIGALFHETSALKNIGKDIQDWYNVFHKVWFLMRST